MLCAYVCSRAARGRVTGVLRASSRATAAKVQMQMTSVIVVHDGRRTRTRTRTDDDDDVERLDVGYVLCDKNERLGDMCVGTCAAGEVEMRRALATSSRAADEGPRDGERRV